MNIPNVHEMILDELAELKRMVQELKDVQIDKNGVDPEKYLTVEKTAEFLDCTVSHVYKIQQRVAHIKRGGRVYFALSDLHKYMEAGKQMPRRE